jgi:streptomycin 6-kinase
LEDRVTIVVPPKLAEHHARFYGDRGREWTAGLPRLAERFLAEWGLAVDGEPMHGMVGLIVPVLRADGTPAVLKLAPIDEEHPGEAAALRAWNGDGAVRLLEEDPPTWTMLLERVSGARDLTSVPDDLEAVRIIAELLARLHRHPAPPGIQSLADVAGRMVQRTPGMVAPFPVDQARLIQGWADRVAEVLPEPGDALLHWDLHYENVLAADREPWLAIDPKPLAGDPGFDLLPALWNRWDEVVGSGDPVRHVLRRFDLMVEVMGLDRDRAVVWSLGRVLQNVLWNIEDNEPAIDDIMGLVATALTSRP